eukprot:11509414-Alexandrium_andersonii.AAC.1
MLKGLIEKHRMKTAGSDRAGDATEPMCDVGEDSRDAEKKVEMLLEALGDKDILQKLKAKHQQKE